MTENNDLMNDMVKDSKEAEGENLDSDKLERLSALCNLLGDKEEEMAELENQLKIIKKEADDISMNWIPDLFDEIQLSKIKLLDGREVEVILDYVASITKANKDWCHKWLRDNGHEGLIKHEITAKLKKGEMSEANAIMIDLDKRGVGYDAKEYVHHSTLKSFVKEMITGGEDFPLDQFGVIPIRKTKIK